MAKKTQSPMKPEGNRSPRREGEGPPKVAPGKRQRDPSLSGGPGWRSLQLQKQSNTSVCQDCSSLNIFEHCRYGASCSAHVEHSTCPFVYSTMMLLCTLVIICTCRARVMQCAQHTPWHHRFLTAVSSVSHRRVTSFSPPTS